MITISWWLLVLLAAGTGAAVGFAVAMARRARTDLVVADRVEAILADALERLITGPVQVDPELPPAVDPWSMTSLGHLFDDLKEPVEPVLPVHDWLRDPTGALIIPPLAEPEPAKATEGKPKQGPRQRFDKEPKLPKEVVVATTVGDEVRSEMIEVSS